MHSNTRNVVRAALALSLLASLFLIAACSKVGPSVDMTPTAHLAVDAHIGKGYTEDSTRVENITKDFGPNDMVAAAVDVPGHKGESVRAVWVYNGQIIQEHTTAVQDDINVYRFRLEPPAGGHQLGNYTFEIYIGGKKVESEKFSVHA
jgi:hypothetical protein